MKLKLAAAIAAALLSSTAMADSWDVTQTSTPTTSTTMTQEGNTSASSVQAMNAVNSDTATVTSSSTGQKVILGTTALQLDQQGTTENSTQAANYLKGNVIGATGTPFKQTHSGSGTVTLNQNTSTLGAGNLQAVNAAKGATVTDLTQELDAGVGAVTLNQATAGQNTQAINSLEATTTLTKATQTVTPTGRLILNQAGAGSQTQAANLVRGGAIGGNLSQTTAAGSAATEMNQTGSGTSTQALNMIDATSADGSSTAGTAIQTATGALTMKQSGSNGIQTGNRVVATGAIGATNTFIQKHTGAAALELNQTAGNANLQAVNSAKGAAVTGLTQDATTATTATLIQSTAGSLNTQAINNAEATTSMTSVIQKAQPTAAADALSLSQSAGGGNVQAANRAAGGTAAIGTLAQTAGLAGKDSKMTQNGGTAANTQALNMATGVGVSNTSTQNAYGVVDMKQGNTGAVFGGSVQAGNYLKSSGTDIEVKLATQNLGSGANNITLNQKGGTSGTVQAGNLIDMSAPTGTSKLTSGVQDITTTGTLSLDQNNATTSALQAGNAVLTGANSCGKAAQTVNVGTLSMLQTGSAGAFQAASYVGKKIP
jgi:hypothetical protein